METLRADMEGGEMPNGKKRKKKRKYKEMPLGQA